MKLGSPNLAHRFIMASTSRVITNCLKSDMVSVSCDPFEFRYHLYFGMVR